MKIPAIFELGSTSVAEILEASTTPIAEQMGITHIRQIVGPDTYKRKPPLAISGKLDPHAEIFRSYTLTAEQSCPPISKIVLQDAIVTYQGTLITRDHRILRESCEPFLKENLPIVGISQLDGGRRYLSSLPTRFVERPTLLVKGPWWRNYGHWLVEGAALIALLREQGALSQHMQIVIGQFQDPCMRAIVHDTLELLCPQNEVLEHPDGETWLFSQLHYVTPIHIPPLFKSPHAFRALRKLLSPQGAQGSRNRRLYVRRTADNRVLTNEERVIDLCRGIGFEIIEPDRLSFSEQIKTFQSAEFVIGVKGAALTNLLFCSEGTAVVVMSPADFSDAFYWDIAAQFDIEYLEIFGPVESRDRPTGRNPFAIELDQFVDLLNRLNLRAAERVVHISAEAKNAGYAEGNVRNDMSSASLDKIGCSFGTDKSSIHHGYLAFYERFLSALRSAIEPHILEIGVAEGASLRMWESYFESARVVGIDKNPGAAVHASKRITIEIADQSDVEALLSIAKKHGPFDLIVDDGSHVWDHQITAFQWLYPFVKPGGYYIMEDIDTSYGGAGEAFKGVGQISAAKYLQGFCDYMVGDSALNWSELSDAFVRSYARRTEFIAFHRGTAVIRRRCVPIP